MSPERPPRFLPPVEYDNALRGDPMDDDDGSGVDWMWAADARSDWIMTRVEQHIDGVDPAHRAYSGLVSLHANPEAARLRRARHFMHVVAAPERDFPSTEDYAVARAGHRYAYTQAVLNQLGVRS